MGPQDDNVALVMDRAYQGDETRQLALDLGFTPVVPPLKTRTDPWEYDREMYKRRIAFAKCGTHTWTKRDSQGAHSRFPGAVQCVGKDGL